MNDLVRRILEMVLRVGNFGRENAAAIAVNAVAVQKLDMVDAFLDNLTGKGTLKMSAIEMKINESAQRKMTRDELKKDVYEIADAGRTAKKLHPDFDSVFHVPSKNLNDMVLLETARSFHQSASDAAVKNILIKECALPTDFLEDLETDRAAFESAISGQDTATRDRIDAVASIDDTLPQILEAVSILKSIVPRIFRNDAGKLADWASASHVEKAAKKPKTPKP